MDTRVAASLAVTLLVVLAGCTAPGATGTTTGSSTGTTTGSSTGTTTGSPAGTPADASPDGTATAPAATSTAASTPSPTPTPTPVDPDRKVTVKGGTFSFDAATVYRRVVRMHGLTLSDVPDVTVYVRDRASVELSRIYRPSGFERVMGITPVAGDTAIAGLAGGSTVYIYAGVVTSATEREAVLAHEYAHVVQGVLGVHSTVRAGVDGMPTQEGRVETGVIEGGSTFVENRYRVRYLGQEPRRLDWNVSRRGRTAFGAFLVAPYTFGHRYIFRRIDSVRDLSRVYEDPPRTTEQLIHNYDPEAEPPRPLDAAAATDGTGWSVRDRKTKGELFVRLVLEPQLSSGRAATAAAGWGNDRVLAFERGDDRGYAWVTRWDDAGNASEFAAALRAYLDERGRRVDGGWTVNGTRYRVVRPTDEAVVLLAGEEAFVAAATVTGSDGSFTVEVSGESALASVRPAAGAGSTADGVAS